MSAQFINQLPSVFPLRPLVDDASPKSTAQLCAGDIVITSFRQDAAGDGTLAMHIVPTVNIAMGTHLNVTRYSRTASPTTSAAAGMTLNLTTSAPLRRGHPYYIIGAPTTMELHDIDANVYGAALPGQAWPASATDNDTIMVYTQAGTFCPLHAVGFRGTDGSLPVYGSLAPEATVTLPAPATPGPKVYMALYINTSPAFIPISSDVTAVIPAAGMQALARTMYMNGGTGFVDIGVVAGTTNLPDFLTHITPAVGSMVFTQYFLGSPVHGFTRWEVVTLEPMAAGTQFSFGKSSIEDYGGNTRYDSEQFTITVPTDVAAGDSFRVSTGVQSSAVVVQVTYRPVVGAVQDWTSAITSNTLTPTTSPAAAWRSVYAQALHPFRDDITYVLGALHTAPLAIEDDMSLSSVSEFERLPASARSLWPERGVLLPNKQLRMNDVNRELLKSAKPEPGITGVMIV